MAVAVIFNSLYRHTLMKLGDNCSQKIVIWGGKSSVLWSEISFNGDASSSVLWSEISFYGDASASP